MTISTSFSARNESIKLSIILTCLCLAILYGDWVWRLDRLIYDAQSSVIQHAASDEIVIIAIDETSLNSIGRWPWPRNIHADLINKLSEHQAKAILIDVIFSESSLNSQDDLLLAEAIENNEKVVLPILLEQTRLRGHLLETLPLPIFTQAAASIGHVHIELDPDGIARGTYLFEGLGEARWPHIGLALLKMLNEIEVKPVNDSKHLNSITTSQWAWIREHHFLIPYIGPPGSFQTTSYVNVLNDQILPGTLKDKIVLVGVTAAGLGDSLPTPVSGLARAMPGIEINANIIQAIKSNSLISTLPSALHYLLAGCLVMLPILLFPYLSPRMSLVLVISEASLLIVSSLILLHWLHIWIPISATLIALSLAYPLWAWRRLEFTVQYLNTELETLSIEANEIERYATQNVDQSFNSLKNLIPINGISIFTQLNEKIFSQGESCDSRAFSVQTKKWIAISKFIYARNIKIDDSNYIACIHWSEENKPTVKQENILKTYIRQQVRPDNNHTRTTVELIESRIRDIQSTTDKLSYLRHFITDSLEQMADGVIVVDSLGIVTLANHQAILHVGKEIPLLHQPIQSILNTLMLNSGDSWEAIIRDLLNKKHYENLQVRTNKHKDLIINISPLYNAKKSIVGFIINLSDITDIKDAQRKRSEMLSFLSHDLRSPLVSILAMIEQKKISDSISSFELGIEKNINHTIQLAENFVHLSRIESDEEIVFNQVNMSDIIANAVDTVWAQAQIKKMTIIQHINIDGWVSGNGSILERIAINLLTNAIKYCDNNSIITISLECYDESIICCINDNGPGIPKDQLPYLFDRFSRAQNNSLGSVKGIGLGLAFVHAAVERHHGTINVKSNLGEGTKICMSIPQHS